MSKAFVKEDSDQDSNDSGGRVGQDLLPNGSKNYMTPQGAARLQAELKQLLYDERPRLVETVAWAASNGDRSENGDYIYGKKRLREIDRRIRFLTKRLDHLEIVDPTQQKSDKVLFGATVTVLDEEGDEKRYSIVGVDEAEASRGKVSWISPIGKALLQSQVGDVVTLRVPKGEIELEIVRIEYVKIADE